MQGLLRAPGGLSSGVSGVPWECVLVEGESWGNYAQTNEMQEIDSVNTETSGDAAPVTHQTWKSPRGSEKKSSGAELGRTLPPSSSFSRGASSHVAASLFRYQGRIVRIVCIRAQLLASLPLSPVAGTHTHTHTHLQPRRPPVYRSWILQPDDPPLSRLIAGTNSSSRRLPTGRAGGSPHCSAAAASDLIPITPQEEERR